jgi:hypothetical protein
MNDLDPFLRIIVSDHALDRAHERLGDSGCALLQVRYPSGGTLASAIRAEVRIGIFADRVTDVRPQWTRGDSMNRQADFNRDTRFVYDPDALRCWLVEQSRANQSALVVKTLLLSSVEESRLSQDKHIRAGQVRR